MDNTTYNLLEQRILNKVNQDILPQVTNIIISNAKRTHNTVTPKGTTVNFSPILNVNPINQQGNGTLFTFNNSNMYYFEQLNFFKEFKELLTKLQDLTTELQQSVGTAPSGGGPVVNSPTLIQKALTLQTTVLPLIEKLP